MSDTILSPERNKGNRRFLFPKDYIVLDLETTGFSPQNDDIIEIAMLKYQNSQLVSHFESFVKPSKPIPINVARLTGITDYTVCNAPTIDHIINHAVRFMGNDFVIGHNVNFDINFVYDNYMRCEGKEFKNDYIDTMAIAQKVTGVKQKLTTLAAFYGINTNGAHRAINDCFVCNDCFLRLQDSIKEKGMSLAEFSGLYDPVLSAQQLSLFDMSDTGCHIDNGRVVIDNGPMAGKVFKSSFGSHTFTPDEMRQLAHGQEIEVKDFMTKDGRKINMRGRLGEGRLPNGRTYFGFQRTDLQKRPVPSCDRLFEEEVITDTETYVF